MKANCAECNHRWVCDIDPNECDLWPDSELMTNADHIRSMTDEELMVLLMGAGISEAVCPNDCDGCDGNCERHMLEWLKQPYKEEPHAENP